MNTLSHITWLKHSRILSVSSPVLPGCSTPCRLRTPDTHKPLLIANQLIQDYSENRIDTLHMKNLLRLGEDRYLTTLLKHFPRFKTQPPIWDAYAYTAAPDDWRVLLSQRRRWINPTVHNLGELIFYCFSVFRCHDRSYYRGLCKPFLGQLNSCSRNLVDRLPHLPGRGTRQIHSNALFDHGHWSSL
jgi:hypothetical protein